MQHALVGPFACANEPRGAAYAGSLDSNQKQDPRLSSSAHVTAQFDWRLAECAKAIRQITRYRPGPPWLRWARWAAVAILALGGAFAMLGFALRGWPGVLSSLPWMILILLWIALLSGGFAWLTTWQLKRNNPHILAGQEHHISAAGYQVRCGAVTSTTGWEGIQRFVETDAFFLVFPVRNAAYFLPKRCLTPDQVTGIQLLARAGLSDRSVFVAV